MRKAFVLLSGGLDSTTCLYQAIFDSCTQDMSHGYGDPEIVHEWLTKNHSIGSELNIDWVEAVSFDYGQRHSKEMDYARQTCAKLGITHKILSVGELLGGATVMLSKASFGAVTVPDISYDDIKGVSPTYVPFRNGTMLSLLAAHAQKWVNSEIDRMVSELDNNCYTMEHGEDARVKATRDAADSVGIYFGAHSEDAHNWAYPDCTPEFIGAMANAIYVGTYRAARLHTPLQWLGKADVVTLGDKLGVPFDQTWSCYKGEPLHCGICPTCRSRKQAFISAKVEDPTEYAQ